MPRGVFESACVFFAATPMRVTSDRCRSVRLYVSRPKATMGALETFQYQFFGGFFSADTRADCAIASFLSMGPRLCFRRSRRAMTAHHMRGPATPGTRDVQAPVPIGQLTPVPPIPQ